MFVASPSSSFAWSKWKSDHFNGQKLETRKASSTFYHSPLNGLISAALKSFVAAGFVYNLLYQARRNPGCNAIRKEIPVNFKLLAAL